MVVIGRALAVLVRRRRLRGRRGTDLVECTDTCTQRAAEGRVTMLIERFIVVLMNVEGLTDKEGHTLIMDVLATNLIHVARTEDAAVSCDVMTMRTKDARRRAESLVVIGRALAVLVRRRRLRGRRGTDLVECTDTCTQRAAEGRVTMLIERFIVVLMNVEGLTDKEGHTLIMDVLATDLIHVARTEGAAVSCCHATVA